MATQKIFWSKPSNYSPNHLADRHRGITYKDSQMDFIANLIVNNATIRTLAESISAKLKVKNSANVYAEVNTLIDECEKMRKRNFSRNNLDLFLKVRQLLVLHSQH